MIFMRLHRTLRLSVLHLHSLTKRSYVRVVILSNELVHLDSYASNFELLYRQPTNAVVPLKCVKLTY